MSTICLRATALGLLALAACGGERGRSVDDPSGSSAADPSDSSDAAVGKSATEPRRLKLTYFDIDG